MAVTWNPSDKSTYITLSNGNLTATNTANSKSLVRATEYKSSGKWYWEIYFNTSVDTNFLQFGIANSSAGLYVLLGESVNGWGYQGYNGNKQHNLTSTAYGNSWTSGDIIGIALDMTAGKIWWAKNNVWQASGDPAAGTNEAYSGISGNIYAAVTLRFTNEQITARFDSNDFTYTPPSGFSAYSPPEDTYVDVTDFVLSNSLDADTQFQLSVQALSNTNTLSVSDVLWGYPVEVDTLSLTNSLDSDIQIGIDTANLSLSNSLSAVPTFPVDCETLSLTNTLVNPNIFIVQVVNSILFELTNSLSSTLKNQIYLTELTLNNTLSSSPQVQLDTPNLILTNTLVNPEVYIGYFLDPPVFTVTNSLSGNTQIGLYSEIFSLTNSLSSVPQIQLFSQVFELSNSLQTVDIVQFTTEHADVYYLFTLTGSADSTTDIEIPIKSFQGRLRQGDPSYLSLVVPGIDYSDEIIARSNGDLVIDMAFKQAGAYIQREEIARVELEDIRIDQGARNQSITLSGHKTETYSVRTVNISMSPTYYGSYGGKVRYRFSKAMIDLHPGDTAVVGVDSFEIGNITYTIGVATQTMEVVEV